MTPNEFAQLTGKDTAADNFMQEYVQADRIYLAAGNLDKQTFCKDYSASGATATLCALTEKVEKCESFIDEQRKRINNAAYALIIIAATFDDAATDSSVYQQAINLIGRKMCIKYKLEKNLTLSVGDRKFLLSGLDSIPNND